MKHGQRNDRRERAILERRFRRVIFDHAHVRASQPLFERPCETRINFERGQVRDPLP